MNAVAASLFALGALERGAAQKVSELAPALEFLAARGAPRSVLEIGTLRGGTLWAWAQIATDDAVIVSVDLPGGPWGGGYVESDVPRLEGFVGEGQTLHLIRGDSHSVEVAAHVHGILCPAGVDLLFIDGDHSREGVGQDFVDYLPLVNVGGAVVFHDVLDHPDVPGCDVHGFWESLKTDSGMETVEFCSPQETHPEWGQWGGIGVVAL